MLHLPLQDQLVGILKGVLGHHLFIPAKDQLSRDGKWLSPEALKHKVVLRMKVKPGACPGAEQQHHHASTSNKDSSSS